MKVVGKDRYPYPVGYQAIRAHNGTTYKMEICEGVNGPRFLISSDDGGLSSGKTPDQAWEEFQKKGCPRMKIWHGKRLSSKMDGLEEVDHSGDKIVFLTLDKISLTNLPGRYAVGLKSFIALMSCYFCCCFFYFHHMQLFGFKNPLIQRLLREVVTDVNGIAEQSLISPKVCDSVTRTDHDDCCPNVGENSDLLHYVGKLHVTGKRSKCEPKNKKLNVQARPQSLELTCSISSNVKDEKSLGQGSSTTHYGSEVNGVYNHIGGSASLQIMSSVGKSSNYISSKDGLLLNPIDISNDKIGGAVPSKRPSGFLYSENCKITELTEYLSTEESLHRSHNEESKISSLLVISEDKKLMQSCSKESVGCIDIDLCAPDTLDFVQASPQTIASVYPAVDCAHKEAEGCLCRERGQCIAENTSDSAPNKLDKNASIETACEITSRDLLNAEHEELLKSNSNPSSEKSDFGAAGQDVAKSMISLLLPQAVPLLRNVSTDKEFTISPSDMLVDYKQEVNEIGYSLDVPSSDVVMTEAVYREQGEIMHGPHTDSRLNIPNSEHLKSIVPDSFEYSQCDDLKTNQEILSSDVAESDRSSLSKDMCSQQLPGHDLLDRTTTYHASGLDFQDGPQDCNLCIPESVPDDISPRDQIISERSNNACSDLKENPVHVGFDSMQKDLLTAQDFTRDASNASGVKTDSCHLKSMESPEKRQSEVMGKTGNAETMIRSSQLPMLVYTRRKLQNAIPVQESCSVMECTEHDTFKLVNPEMYTAKGALSPQETIQINNSNDISCEPDVTAGLCVETPQTCNNVLVPNPTSSLNPTPFACENKCFADKEAQLISESMPLENQELKNNLDSSVKFVGCYMHPMPVSSLFLSTRNDEIHVCVLCGLLSGQYRTLFTYKVAINEPSLGCPSVMAHCSILLPDPKHNFIKDLTPDGQYIVLLGSIKTPNCRLTVSTVCSEKDALKIVQIEHGYVSVVTMLETVDNVHCILVCEPNRLVSVGESGRLQVWVMNSTWSEKVEYFIVPADGSISPGIVRLKRIPKCTHLVIGHNSYGEFSLWDIAKLNCVSSFSALGSPINEFFPISLFHWQTKGSRFSNASISEQADKLLEATNLWYSKQRETCSFSPSEEDVAMWLFVSTTSDIDIHTTTSWRLALVMKNCITFGSPLDPRSYEAFLYLNIVCHVLLNSVNLLLSFTAFTVFNVLALCRTTDIGVSCGYGIASTSDGVVYMWELSRGSKLGTLHHFQDDNVTCVATDDSGGALGVAGSRGQLLLYLHHPDLDSN
ncbi:hypothetical protein VNO77_02643 [Canavalia gladiata]|uniref:FYR C-terminal domain-containing protein n=1 Tax=Canavalia gladiata TaxID=3824 RepID=A0AAN9R378_CANGL